VSSAKQKIPLKEQLKNLEHIQELDLRIDQINKKKEELPIELKNIDLKILQFTQNIEVKNTEKEDIQKNLRQVQAALELNEDRATRAQGKLDGVTSGDEFQAATKELEQLKKFNESFLEQKKKTQDLIDALDLSISEFQKSIDDLNTEKAAKQAEIATQEGSLNKDLNELLEKRGEYVVNVERPTLSRYDRIRTARDGVGLAPASAGRCNSCNMMIPPQLFNQLMKVQEMTQCPCCQRVLYYLE